MRSQRVDLAMYLQAFPVYARNLAVLLAPLIAALLALGLLYAEGPLFAAIGGAGDPLVGFIIQLLYGFAFAISVIVADDAWRHGHANVGRAWSEARRKAGAIFIAVLGFFFLVFVAQMIGGMLGFVGTVVLGALAIWAFIYAIPAAAIGGVPGGAAFSASLQAARRHPLGTAMLAVVSILVWYGVTVYGLPYAGTYLNGPAYDVALVLLKAVALGYIALIVAKQYSDLAFRPYW